MFLYWVKVWSGVEIYNMNVPVEALIVEIDNILVLSEDEVVYGATEAAPWVLTQVSAILGLEGFEVYQFTTFTRQQWQGEG